MSSWRTHVPGFLKSGYHAANAWIAACRYGFPGKKLIIIGITGTKGKTSSANLIWSVLAAGGYKTGLIGTANIRIGNEERINRMHMTMPGEWTIQKFLREMLDASCTHAVMEVTSEGLKQYRHVGIEFKVAVFTNLSPEHLASHSGSFEKYKQMKGKLFATLSGQPGTLSIINADSEHKDYYAAFKAEKVITYGLSDGAIRAVDIRETSEGTSFTVGYTSYRLHLLGTFNIANALPAIIIGREFNVPENKIREGLTSLSVIPGRMEKIEEGQPYTVIVDYAHEKLSINALLDTAKGWATNGENIIVIIGAEGGGRDPAKREHMGRAAGVKADYVVVTTTDPYDDDPQMLAEAVASFAERAGKERDRTLFVILDRREGIKKALSLARAGDIVLITGMGAQETMIVKGKALPWNEREIVRELIKERETEKS